MNERLKPFEEKMKKTIGNLDGEQINGRILWNTDTNPAGSKRIRTGSTYDSDPAMGKENGKRD